MSTSAKVLIKAALRVNGVIASGETPTDPEMADGLEATKMILRNWAAEGLMVEILTEITHTLVAGDADYTVGSATADIDSDWPVEIVSGYCRVDGLDYPLTIIDEQDYDRIGIKTTAGTPSKLFYKPTYPHGVFYLYYVPESAMEIVLKAQTLLDEPDKLTTAMVFPPFYDSAIKWNLAYEIAPEYEQDPSKTVIERAMTTKAVVEARNATMRTQAVEVNIKSMYGNYSIEEQ